MADGAKLLRKLYTAVACKNTCLLDPWCAGFDFNDTQNSCWIHTSATIRPLLSATDMDNYKRMDSCKMPAGMYSCNVFRRCYKQSCELMHNFVGQTYPEKSTTEFIITPSPY